jgi:hypothetical protein
MMEFKMAPFVMGFYLFLNFLSFLKRENPSFMKRGGIS